MSFLNINFNLDLFEKRLHLRRESFFPVMAFQILQKGKGCFSTFLSPNERNILKLICSDSSNCCSSASAFCHQIQLQRKRTRFTERKKIFKERENKTDKTEKENKTDWHRENTEHIERETKTKQTDIERKQNILKERRKRRATESEARTQRQMEAKDDLA